MESQKKCSKCLQPFPNLQIKDHERTCRGPFPSRSFGPFPNEPMVLSRNNVPQERVEDQTRKWRPSHGVQSERIPAGLANSFQNSFQNGGGYLANNTSPTRNQGTNLRNQTNSNTSDPFAPQPSSQTGPNPFSHSKRTFNSLFASGHASPSPSYSSGTGTSPQRLEMNRNHHHTKFQSQLNFNTNQPVYGTGMPKRIFSEDPNNRLSNPPPPVPQSYRKEYMGPSPRIEESPSPSVSEALRCPGCTDFFLPSEFANHRRECPNRICTICSEYYPKCIFSEHLAVCRETHRMPTPLPQNSHSPSSNSFFPAMAPFGSVSNSARRSSSSNSSSSHEDEDNLVLFGSGMQPVASIRSSSDSNRPGEPVVVRMTSTVRFGQPVRTQIIIRDGNQLRTIEQVSGNGGQEDFNSALINHRLFMQSNRDRMRFGFIVNLINSLSNPNQGINRDDLNLFEEKTYKKSPGKSSAEPDSCTICLGNYEEGEKVRNLPCKHFFHTACIDTWLVQNSHCPLCKRDLNPRN